jgi:hypothetical protein
MEETQFNNSKTNLNNFEYSPEKTSNSEFLT